MSKQTYRFNTETAKAAAELSKKSRAQSAKAWRRLSRELAKYGLTSDVIITVKDIVIELIRAANSNPMIGVLLAILVTDILYRLGIISFTAVALMYAIIGIDASAVVADDISSILGALNPLKNIFGGSSQQIDPFTPSATTIVYASGSEKVAGQGSAADLQALLSQLRKPTTP